MQLANNASSTTVMRKLRWEREPGEQRPYGPIPFHRGRKRPMIVTAVEASLVKLDDGDWTGTVLVEGPIVLANPVAGRTQSLQRYRQIIFDVEGFPWVLELIRTEIPDYLVYSEDEMEDGSE